MDGQTTQQFRVLYRDFLFRIVDRELLSTYAKGDASQLLLQIAALLIFLSVCFSIPALGVPTTPSARLWFALSIEHFLIATTMLVTGVFAVLSWDSMFPNHGDVFVLAPLPIRAQTILLAKLAAVATAVALAVVMLHALAGLVWPMALTAGMGVGAWGRLVIAYWLTMIAAAAFTFGLAMSVQGIAASVLPRRYFLRVSSLLQLAAFGVLVGGYFLQPMAVRPAMLTTDPQGWHALSPSYWFLGLLQRLGGSPVLDPLADRAWAGLGVVVVGTVGAYALSYFRTLRRIAEQPDLAPAATRLRWLPPFGDPFQTAVVQFALRTLLRSAPHRLILAFYWGIAFALTVLFLKTPRGQRLAAEGSLLSWQEASVPLLVSSILMMVCAVVAGRLAFAMPRDLRANWVFRIMPVQIGPRYVAARRRALAAVSVGPAWTVWAVVVLSTWPWRPAVAHLVALGMFGLLLVEVCLSGVQKIPFTCSYLPGKSRLQLVGYMGAAALLPATMEAATFERAALQDPARYAVMLSVIAAAWLGVRAANVWLGSAAAAPDYDDQPLGQLTTLQLWDSRFSTPETQSGDREL